MSASSTHLGFAIIGAMKCGTTSVFDFLAEHPDVCAPRNKEPHYFTRGYRLPASYYRFLFKHRQPGQLCGEASPTYSWVERYPECPARLAADAPDVRLILLIRDPLDRVLSHLRHRELVGTTEADLDAAVRYPELWQRSAYETTLTAYLRHFDRERILVADIDDLRDPTRLRRVLDHLALDPAPLDPLRLPAANASADRLAVPGLVGRLASTPVGAMVRDLVPRRVVHRAKRPLERPVQDPGPPASGASPAGTGRLTADDLRRIAPAECAKVEAEYAAVRRDWIDAG